MSAFFLQIKNRVPLRPRKDLKDGKGGIIDGD